jgi:hypothetical protein
MPTERIKPNPECKACHGSGEIIDFVPMPFGSGDCQMPSFCDCVIEQLQDEDADIELDLNDYYAALGPEPEMPELPDDWRAEEKQAKGERMSEAKHTKGPWTILHERGKSQVRTVVAGAFQVCDCVGLTPDADPDGGDLYADLSVNLANAHLIAAAPDLLAAAETVLADLNARIGAAPDTAKPVFNGIADLHAAIAKAKGEQ